MNEVRKRLHCNYFEYDTKRYPFKDLIESFMGVELGSLHSWLGNFDVFTREVDQFTLPHRVFYANFEKQLAPVYKDFIRHFIQPIIDEPFYYQVIPTFRVGLPGNKFVGEYHKDSAYNHLPYEVNFNLGLANYGGPASLQVEKEEGSGEFGRLSCEYGQVFSFDHIDCLHGANPNELGVTMVSMDFRLALKSLYYDDPNAKSLNAQSKFEPGGYFSEEVVGPK